MKIPNYLFEEFVDNNILNTGFADILASMQQFPGESTFFIPGIVTPSLITFAFNGNLIVTVNAGSQMLFGSGALTAAHGVTNGVDSSIYSVNFTGLVPSIGSVTAYIVAQYIQIQLDSTVILGAPPGHPDYSANFVPYVGYTRLQDSWSVFATTTPPDNFTTFELARTTLSAGQSSIVTVDTSHQQIAGLNINPSGFGIAGDVTGTLSHTIVQRSSAATFFANNINAAGNINAAAVAAAGNITAGGSVVASFDLDAGRNVNASNNISATVDVLAGLDLGTGRDADIGRNANVTNNVSAGGNVTAGGFLSAIGQVFGANASVANAAVMLGQLLGSTLSASGPNTQGFFHVPIWTGSAFARALIQFGSVQPVGFIGAGGVVGISYPTAFTGLSGIILCTTISGNGGSVVNGSQSVNGFQFQANAGCIGVYWVSIGN